MQYLRKLKAKIKKEDDEIARFKREIGEIQLRLRDAENRRKAYDDALRFYPDSERDKGKSDHPLKGLRKGSMADRARDALRDAGHSMKIRDILTQIGEEQNKNRRQTLGGILSSYERKKEIFTRPEPGVFGLIEFKNEGKFIIPEGIEEVGEENDDSETTGHLKAV